MDTGTNKRQNNNSNSEAQKKRRVTLTNKQRYDDTLNNAGNIIDSPVGDGLDTLNARKRKLEEEEIAIQKRVRLKK